MRKLLFILPLLAASCMTDIQPRGPTPVPLINALGAPIGSVRAWQTPAGVTFQIRAAGLAPGIHGLHVHGVGRCDPPDFASAGGHWNPLAKKHGTNNPAGPHAGDLTNVEVNANGVLMATVTLAGGSLAAGGLLDADGAALVLHAKADDYVTDPSGNSGGRIACAVIVPAVPQQAQ
jgi:Cu-Zn family superoxide dismutase